MALYEETVHRLRALAERAQTTENVLFCERRPLTSLEARYAGAEPLARDLRGVEDEALRALQRLVDAEQGYETALRAIEQAGAEAAVWLHAVTLARALEQ
jgi:phosphoribosyl-dephospho-CoA transferase